MWQGLLALSLCSSPLPDQHSLQKDNKYIFSLTIQDNWSIKWAESALPHEGKKENKRLPAVLNKQLGEVENLRNQVIHSVGNWYKKRTGLSSRKQKYEGTEQAYKDCSPGIAPSQDILGVNRDCSMVLCKGSKVGLVAYSGCLPGKSLPLDIWAELKELWGQSPLICWTSDREAVNKTWCL